MAGATESDHLAVPNLNAWFFKETSLDDLVRDTAPLSSIDELALDDLTPEQAESFLRAINE